MKRLLLAAAFVVAGCQQSHWVLWTCAQRNEVVRVESGGRLFFDLPVEPHHGWDAVDDDDDVDVFFTREDDHVKVELRVHRGYDGPSVVKFRYRKDGSRAVLKEFTLSLFRRTGDQAYWKDWL